MAATPMGTESYFYKMDRVHVDGAGGGGVVIEQCACT